MNRKHEPTLCFPDAEKSCFACCPPIRTAGYEHIQYKNIIKRILRENTRAFAGRKQGISPITGYSCWALGYLDKEYRLVGCLLHPSRNKGEELRYRIDYGEKCKRESCIESKIFMTLSIKERKFWLHLADGFDSFSYSSATINPLFHIMGWGSSLLRLIAMNEDMNSFSKEFFSCKYIFFHTSLNPRANAYLINQILKKNNLHLLKSESFLRKFEVFSERLSEQISKAAHQTYDAPYTHLLDLDHLFLNFLRLSAGLVKINKDEACRLKDIVDKDIQQFKKTIRDEDEIISPGRPALYPQIETTEVKCL